MPAQTLVNPRWNRAAFLLMMAFACKPTCLILILLVGAIYPRMRERLGITLIGFGFAPFFTQSPDYVISQYAAFLQNSKVAYGDGETGYWAYVRDAESGGCGGSPKRSTDRKNDPRFFDFTRMQYYRSKVVTAASLFLSLSPFRPAI